MTPIKARSLRMCGLSVLLSMASVQQTRGQGAYSMDLDAPQNVGREQSFDVMLRGTSNAVPALGLIGFTAKLAYDPQVLTLEAVTFNGTDFANPDVSIVDDTVSGTVVVVAILDVDGVAPLVVPGGVGLSLAQLTFKSGSCLGASALSFRGGIDDNVLADELLLGHDIGNDLVLNGASVNVDPTGFIRGNADGDDLVVGDYTAAIDMADGLFIIDFLFTGGNAPPCLDAADSNDDGRINLLDPIWIFQYLIMNPLVGPALPGPFTTIGDDPTEDTLDCLSPPLSTLCESP